MKAVSQPWYRFSIHVTYRILLASSSGEASNGVTELKGRRNELVGISMVQGKTRKLRRPACDYGRMESREIWGKKIEGKDKSKRNPENRKRRNNREHSIIVTSCSRLWCIYLTTLKPHDRTKKSK